MGATHLNAKGNIDTKTSRRRAGGGWFFNFGACFGLYMSSSHKKHKKNLYDDPVHIHDHHGGDIVESVKYGKKRPNSAESNVIPPSESIKEIQIVAAAASPPLLLQTSFDQGTILEERSKIKQEQSTDTVNVRDIWSDPTGPAPPRRRQEKTAAGKTVNKDETTSAASEFDSVVGALIMTLTLAVMLIWGKICAIFCSAAWVLFIYCLKQNNESSGRMNDSNRQICDLDSHEYKKRVVLQGLLERM